MLNTDEKDDDMYSDEESGESEKSGNIIQKRVKNHGFEWPLHPF